MSSALLFPSTSPARHRTSHSLSTSNCTQRSGDCKTFSRKFSANSPDTFPRSCAASFALPGLVLSLSFNLALLSKQHRKALP